VPKGSRVRDSNSPHGSSSPRCCSASGRIAPAFSDETPSTCDRQINTSAISNSLAVHPASIRASVASHSSRRDSFAAISIAQARPTSCTSMRLPHIKAFSTRPMPQLKPVRGSPSHGSYTKILQRTWHTTTATITARLSPSTSMAIRGDGLNF
jgi:hypothetical protein